MKLKAENKKKLNRTVAIIICTLLTLVYYIIALFYI